MQGDRAVHVTLYDLTGSAIDPRIVAQVETFMHQLVWGSGENSLAWDIIYVEAG